MLEKICSPALLYLAFSMVQITIDLFQGQYETSLLKFIIMFIFTAILNILCINGYTKIVWFIVIIPIILLTYISSILFYMFGINPGQTNLRVQKKQGQSQDPPKGPGQSQGQVPPSTQPQPQPQPMETSAPGLAQMMNNIPPSSK
jgi:amino acid transporter